jgi:hypothetical protein
MTSYDAPESVEVVDYASRPNRMHRWPWTIHTTADLKTCGPIRNIRDQPGT